MAVTTTAPSPGALADWIARRGPAAGVEGLNGRLRLAVSHAPVGVLKAEGGAAEIVPDGEATTDVMLDTNDLPTLIQLLGGELHPVVARLQGRATLDGDVGFGLRILLGLQAGSPWTGLVPRS